MTTLAMIFGMLPTALALGEGGEFRAPMARAVIGGLITSTLLTLVVVPVVYTYLDDFGAWCSVWAKKWFGEPEGAPDATRPVRTEVPSGRGDGVPALGGPVPAGRPAHAE